MTTPSKSLLLILLLLLLAACTGTSAEPTEPAGQSNNDATTLPTPTLLTPTDSVPVDPTVVPSPTVELPAPTDTSIPQATPTIPQATPTIPPTPVPLNDSTDINAFIDLILSNDTVAIQASLAYLDIACTTTDGLGGPPKCGDGQADGTIVTVLPIAGPGEGSFLTPDTIDNIFPLEIDQLHTVYTLKDTVYTADYWPAGSLAFLFLQPNSQSITFYVTNGQIVRIGYSAFTPSEQIAQEAATIVMQPDSEAATNRTTPTDLLTTYYDAINRRDFTRAYSYWATPPDDQTRSPIRRWLRRHQPRPNRHPNPLWSQCRRWHQLRRHPHLPPRHPPGHQPPLLHRLFLRQSNHPRQQPQPRRRTVAY